MAADLKTAAAGPRVAVVSPLPPARSGAAEYSARLKQALAREVAIEVLDSPDPSALSRYDACIYHIGNNALHGPAYRAALARPGIVVLHDAVLNHLLLGLLSEQEYVEEFVYNHGEWLRPLAEELWCERELSAGQGRYFQYATIRRLVERSRAVVVHNPKARRIALEALRDGDPSSIVEIPHYADPPPLGGREETAATRRDLGIPEEAIVISCFGYLHPAKRLRSLLRAVKVLQAPCRLLLAGDFVSPDYEAALEPLMEEVQLIRLPYAPEEEFWRLAAATDICVNLRSPSAGETSAILVKLMSIGKPVIVTAGEEMSCFPALGVIRVDAGEAEEEMLAHYLYALATDADMRHLIGETGRRHVAKHHNLDLVTMRYLEVIRRAIPGMSRQAPKVGKRPEATKAMIQGD